MWSEQLLCKQTTYNETRGGNSIPHGVSCSQLAGSLTLAAEQISSAASAAAVVVALKSDCPRGVGYTRTTSNRIAEVRPFSQ